MSRVSNATYHCIVEYIEMSLMRLRGSVAVCVHKTKLEPANRAACELKVNLVNLQITFIKVIPADIWVDIVKERKIT